MYRKPVINNDIIRGISSFSFSSSSSSFFLGLNHSHQRRNLVVTPQAITQRSILNRNRTLSSYSSLSVPRYSNSPLYSFLCKSSSIVLPSFGIFSSSSSSVSVRYVSFEGRRKFIDKVRIQVIGGKGGKGVVSYDHVTNWKRKPMGGTGGKGGDIIIETNLSSQDLNFQTYIIRGRPGKDATGNKGSNGRDGTMKTIIVPVGTLVKEIQRSYILDDSEAVENDQDSLRILQQQQPSLLSSSSSSTITKGKSRNGTGSSKKNKEEKVNEENPVSKETIISAPLIDIDKLRRNRTNSSTSVVVNQENGTENDTTSGTNASSAGSSTGEGIIRSNRKGLRYRETVSILADLNIPGQKILVARGGRPGVGNRGSLLTYSEQRDDDLKAHIEGGKGEVRFLELELKTIADVGLVGFPNAGKSSFLTTISKARPKIAAYPFTTLHPHVGVVHYADSTCITVADIPGLIEGAHEDRGLGHEFLRHIERTKVLAYVIDISPGNKDPVGDLQALQNELYLYNKDLVRKPSIVIANKMDIPGSGNNLTQLRTATSLPVLEASAVQQKGMGPIMNSLRWMLDTVRKEEEQQQQQLAQNNPMIDDGTNNLNLLSTHNTFNVDTTEEEEDSDNSDDEKDSSSGTDRSINENDGDDDDGDD